MDLSMSVPTAATPDHTIVSFDPETLTPAQLDGIACVVCGAEDTPMRPVDLYLGLNQTTQLFACSGGESAAAGEFAETQVARVTDRLRSDVQTISAREKTDQARQALLNLLDDGADVGLSRSFLEAFDAEMQQARAELDKLRSRIDNHTDQLMTAMSLGTLASWQIAADLELTTAEIVETMANEQKRAPFTADELQRLALVVSDIIAEREGVTASGWRPTVIPFDADGRCSDASCVSCHPARSSA